MCHNRSVVVSFLYLTLLSRLSFTFQVETLLDEYMNLYDIVLTSDGGFELPLEIVNCIVESKRK